MRSIFFGFILLAVPFVGVSQTISSHLLREFRVEIIGNHVNAQWRTGVDFTCNDVDLYYSQDSNNMDLIYSYPGVCGSNTEEKDYSFIHQNPPYGHLYYQLRLGSFGDSRIHTLHNKKVAEYITYPNPTKDYCRIEFSEVKSGKVKLSFHTADGKILATHESLVKGLEIITSSFPTGIIFFTAEFSDYGTPVNGKFLKI